MIRPLLLILSVERKTKSRDLEKKFKCDTSPYKNIISERAYVWVKTIIPRNQVRSSFIISPCAGWEGCHQGMPTHSCLSSPLPPLPVSSQYSPSLLRSVFTSEITASRGERGDTLGGVTKMIMFITPILLPSPFSYKGMYVFSFQAQNIKVSFPILVFRRSWEHAMTPPVTSHHVRTEEGCSHPNPGSTRSQVPTRGKFKLNPSPLIGSPRTNERPRLPQLYVLCDLQSWVVSLFLRRFALYGLWLNLIFGIENFSMISFYLNRKKVGIYILHNSKSKFKSGVYQFICR